MKAYKVGGEKPMRSILLTNIQFSNFKDFLDCLYHRFACGFPSHQLVQVGVIHVLSCFAFYAINKPRLVLVQVNQTFLYADTKIIKLYHFE